MKITGMVNIIKDNLSNNSLKGMYWNTSKSLHRHKQLLKKDNYQFSLLQPPPLFLVKAWLYKCCSILKLLHNK